MNRRRALRSVAWAAAPGLLAALITGCTTAARVEITSYADPYFPETYYFSPTLCAYRQDAGGDRHILAYSSGDAIGGQAATQQWLHIHVFWNPRPGKTRDNPSSMDAIVRYVIKSSQDATAYSGTAFVYPEQQRTGDALAVLLETGRIHPDAKGATSDMLGESRLKGRLLARQDANAALDLLRQMDVAAGAGQ